MAGAGARAVALTVGTAGAAGAFALAVANAGATCRARALARAAALAVRFDCASSRALCRACSAEFAAFALKFGVAGIEARVAGGRALSIRIEAHFADRRARFDRNRKVGRRTKITHLTAKFFDDRLADRARVSGARCDAKFARHARASVFQ